MIDSVGSRDGSNGGEGGGLFELKFSCRLLLVDMSLVGCTDFWVVRRMLIDNGPEG